MEFRGRFLSAPGVAEVFEQFSSWRASHGGRGRRLPAALWSAAARLAERYGAGRVARTLRLNAVALRRHSATDASATSSQQPNTVPRFVEVASLIAAKEDGCVLEFTGSRGRKLTLRLLATN